MNENAVAKPDPRKVFVIHGRNEGLRESMFELLRRAGLEPREWNSLVNETGHGSPYNLEVVTAGLAGAVAVVALWSGDDLARLRPDLDVGGRSAEQEQRQPRPNVLLETGMALGMKRANVVIVRVGEIRSVSDVDGLNYVVIQDGDQKDTEGRKNLLDRLKAVGAAVDIDGKSDWMSAGNFKDELPPAISRAASTNSALRKAASSGAVQVVGYEIMTSGFPRRNTALKKIVLKNASADHIWRVRLKVTYYTHKGFMGSRSFALGDETTHPPILPKGATVTFSYWKRSRKGAMPPDVRYLECTLTEIAGNAVRASIEVEEYDEVA
ncbi:MAG TPA: nucleotide-binding protein [Planctomycetota bacterium]|nr:nucleotide-binding protein [Planctomycetota bacterium]